jgi:Chaperone of endosialidase
MSYIGNLPFGKTLRTVTSATANGSATVFYPDGGYDVNFVDVFVSGARLSSGLDYTASDGISITMLYTPADGDTIDMVAYGLLELVSPVFPVSVTVGSNVVINTTSISVGNSSVNTQIVAGNVTLNGSTLKVGNSSVNTIITGNSVTIGGTLTVTGNVALTTNSVNSSVLTTTGVIANSYGNTTAIPVITVDAAGRITNATTSSVSGVTGLSFAPANSTVTVSTSTTNFNAAITSGNNSVQGLLKVIDSVSNTSTLIAGSANSVTTAYLLAANAVSNATAYAATAYSNAVATAASDATTKAGTAYSNAVSYANTIAYTAAGTAYSNAVSVAASDATTKAGTAYSNATAYADTKAGTAYSNAISYANTAAGTAYTNATSYADTKAATAYSNVFNGGTFSGAVVAQANLTANNVRVNGNLLVDGDLTISGNTVTLNVTNLNVEDNMIYLNSNSTVSHPDLGFAGNYNDGSYKHAGLFRDATDGVWKFFHGYTPEPDASAFIDTANASFTLSNLQINYVIGNITGSANSATYLGGNTAATLRSYSDTIAGTAYSNATSYAATIASTAYSNAVSVAASDATTKAGTAYSNATSYAATIAGTAYSNAVAIAASDATTKAGTAYSNATSYAATIAGTAYSNATSYAATIAGTAYSNAIAYAASNSYVNSTFLKLTGGTVTGNVAVSAYVHANGTGGATGGYFGMVKIGYGANYGTIERTDSDLYLQVNNAYNVVVGSGGGYLTATNSSRAPIFYDSNDTTYYVDPNSTTAAILAGSIGLGTASPVNTAWGNASTTKQITIYGSDYGLLNLKGDLTTATHYSLGVGNSRYYAAYDNVAAIHRMVFYGDYTGFNSVITPSYNIHLSGTGYATADWRAPIFYDSNDTTYYTDPNGVSVLKNLSISTYTAPSVFTYPGILSIGNIGYNYLFTNGTWTSSVTVGLLANCADQWEMAIHDSGTRVVSPFAFYGGGSNYILMGRDIGWGTTYIQAAESFRAPIFYDSNNTAYYVDPNAGGFSLVGGSSNRVSYVTSDSGIVVSNAEGAGGGVRLGSAYSLPGIYNGGSLYLCSESTISFNPVGGGQRGYIDGSSNLFAFGSMRSPIFYDYNDTGYYLDPNSTSDSALRIRGGALHGPNVTWGAYLLVGGDGRQNYTDNASVASVCATNGNLHLDSASGAYSTHINYYDGSDLIVGAGNSSSVIFRVYGPSNYTTSTGSMRSPVFYDLDNTAYYADPSSTSTSFNSAGTGNFGNGADNTGLGIYSGAGTGDYGRIRFYQAGTNTQTIHIFSTSWQSGTLQSTSAGAINLSGYNGVTIGSWNTITSLGHWFDNNGNGQSSNSFRSPIFYDSGDTTYYLDAAGYSQINGSGSVNGSAGVGMAIFSTVAQNTGAIMAFHRAGRYAVNFGLDSDNVLRIGGWSAAANRWQLDMSGNMTAAGNVTAYSDIRLKENIEIISDALNKVKEIRGVTFTRNDQDDNTKRYAGVIAQEVELVLPEVVSEDNTGIKNVAYGNMVSLLIEAIKEQQQQIEELKSLVNKLIGS